MATICREGNFKNQEIPSVIADEYQNCDFSFSNPLLTDGVLVGHPLAVKAKFVDCNLVNRKTHPEAVVINCNLSIVALSHNYKRLMAVDIPDADEYHNCCFAFMEPLDKNGEKVGHPLDVISKFVECNFVNREPHPEAELIRCNMAVVDTEICEKTIVDHADEINNSNLSDELKKELIKKARYESVSNVIRPHKIYGRIDKITRKYVYREE